MAFWRNHARRSATPVAPPSGFDAAAYARLGERLEAARRLAQQRATPVVASVTVALDPAVEPLAHVAAALEPGQPWSAFSQPLSDGFELASIGGAVRIEAGGDDRWQEISSRAGAALEAAIVDDLFDDPAAPRGAGVVWVGGFAFMDQDLYGDSWRDFAATSFTLPRASIVRTQGASGQARLSLNVQVGADSDVAAELAAAERLVESLRLDEPLEATSFTPVEGPSTVTSVAPPEHYEQAVGRAAEEIRRGDYDKIVLAREITLRRDRAIDPFNALAGLAQRFPECTLFALGEGATTLLGATPELLIRREGRRASTMALAGSMRRGGDPETDAHLGAQLLSSPKNLIEHEIVVRRIERALGRYAAWVSTGTAPELVKVKNIQHLATPIRAQLTEPRPVIELAGALHPTPAVGGEPWQAARGRIRALEGFDRGWYTGGVGWMDLLEDGEFHVSLRSALLDGTQAHLYAGCGIVGDSDPVAELAETETKLEALLPVLRLS